MSYTSNIRRHEGERDIRASRGGVDDPARDLCQETIEYLWGIRRRLHLAGHDPWRSAALLAAETDLVASLVARLRSHIASNGGGDGRDECNTQRF
jgi:hypothetical protein